MASMSKGVVTTVPHMEQATPKRPNTNKKGIEIVKSPSDTTIYAPALCRNTNTLDAVVNNILLPDGRGQGSVGFTRSSPVAGTNFLMNNGSSDPVIVEQQVSNFVEGAREQVRQKERESHQDTPVAGTSRDMEDSNVELAKRKASKIILDAERFKASVNEPPGTYSQEQSHSNVELVNDDNFLHVTCHIEPNLRDKIARGEFIELERLLPKQRGSYGQMNDDNRMNIVQRDGQTFFVPAQNPQRISSIRKWEMAFRVYATIYSEANPSRAAEIRQYVHIINIAASAYVWDNVSYYDTTFRQLMASNPMRPWSKIYNQMWNIAMREPLNRSGPTSYNQGYGSNGQNYNRRSNGANSNNNSN